MEKNDVRRILLTGAAGGVGTALVRALLAEGDVEVHALCRDASRMTVSDPRVVVHTCDLTRPDEIAALDLPAQLHGLVHTAAAGANLTDVEAGVAEWETYLGANVVGAVALTQRCRERLVPGSTLMFLNSGLGLRASPTSVPYSAAKAAIKSYADSIRPEYNQRGVRVTTLYPGQTATPMLAHNTAVVGIAWEPERYIQPGELAALIVSLLGAGASLQLTDVAVRPAVEPW
ncbi:SDR family NAD(P)-dependent oxidoreductase [Nocardioides yefusunii]|uniref:SDR family NAD(P)-dependent oxidoreductase n=1 Tax=Nocardioides yefusunii TaxID=2500546 RepID=A0ABW1R1Z8_9ACTN|nr:SDR family NAD(P)-dependent oxidoreductase [Nocardioides yefusunii]